MTTYQGMKDTYTIIEPCRASGGEGEIFDVRGKKHLVLKRLENRHRTTSRQRKLEAMIRAGVPQALMDQLTWPVDIVYEGSQFVGYVMPALHKMEDLNVIYSDKYKLTLADRVTVAMNLCVPVDGLHQLKQYVGDGNPENICVDPKTLTVTLVDTDSYTVTDRTSGRIYPCVVGLGPYLAPEVQMAMKQYHGLSTVPADTFNEYTDRFWLAVHIFALLMNGAHPFAVRQGSQVSIPHLASSQSSVNLPQPDENICRGFFPHTMKKAGLDIPVYCPQFSYLPASTQNLFIRAFVHGHQNPSARPSAREWFSELGRLQKSLTSGTHCRNHKHQYPSSAAFCPWCELTSRTVPKAPVRTGGGGAGSYTSGNQTGSGTMGGGGGRGRGPKLGCLPALGVILGCLLSFALIMALPVSCTANMINIHRSEEAAREEANRQKIEQLRQEIEENRTDGESDQQNVQSDGPAPYDSGMQADGTWIHPHDERVLQAADVSCHNLNASVSDTMQEVEFGLNPGLDGTYYIQTVDSDQQLVVRLYDDTGFCTASYISEMNGDGIAVEMEAGQMYSLKVERRFADTGDFHIRWWLQKGTEDITNYGAVSDAVEFNRQENFYLFRCSASKEYRFLFTEVAENMTMTVHIYDSNWNRVTSAVDVGQGFGTSAELQHGQNYYIKVSAYSGSGDYTMTVLQNS